MNEIDPLFGLSIPTSALSVGVVAYWKFDRLRVFLKLQPPLVYLIFNSLVRHISVQSLCLVQRLCRTTFNFRRILSETNRSGPCIIGSVCA